MQRLAAFPYRGGKFHLARRIIPLLPPHRIYVEVFGGAASVLIAKPPSKIEVYNDDNGLLVNLFETVRNKPLEFLKKAKGVMYSRQLYETWRTELAQAPHNTETAVKTFYCLVSGFIGDPTKGWAFQLRGKDGGANRWTNLEQRVHMITTRFRHVAIDNLDFRDCIKNWDSPETCFFIDPPYLSTVSKGWYGNNFTYEDHCELAKLLDQVEGKWLLTLDDNEKIWRIYKHFTIRRVSTKLSSQKVERGNSRVDLRHVLISNYYLPEMNEKRPIQSVAG